MNQDIFVLYFFSFWSLDKEIFWNDEFSFNSAIYKIESQGEQWWNKWIEWNIFWTEKTYFKALKLKTALYLTPTSS